MILGMGLLQDEFELSGEFQAFQGWRERLAADSISQVVFGPKGSGLRASGFQRHVQGEFMVRKWFEQWDFIRQAIRVSPDVEALHVFLPTPNFLWIGDRIKAATGRKVLVTCLAEMAEGFPASSWPDILASFRFHAVRVLAAKVLPRSRFQCDRYLTGSASVARQLIRAGCPESSITITPPLLPMESPPDAFTRELAARMEREPTFLYLGHFLPTKGVGILLEAFARIPETNTRLLLAWSGLGNLKETQKQIKRLGIGDRVTLTDRRIHRGTLFSRARALVLPFTASYGQIAPPIVFLEALRTGVPVIMPKISSVAEMAQDGATVLFADPNAASLLEKMNRVLREPSLAETMRRQQGLLYAGIYDGFPLEKIYDLAGMGSRG